MLYIGSSELPEMLHGPVATDELGLPRYWLTIWESMVLSASAHSTRFQANRDVVAFYQYCDTNRHHGYLDAALHRLDLKGIETALDGFFLLLSNKPSRSINDERRWKNVLRFIQYIVTWCAPAHEGSESSKLFRRLKTLEARYAQLRVHRRRKPDPLRALPSSVVQSLYEVLDPDGPQNPFRTARLRWCAFSLFLIFLHLGLRRGEALLLLANSLSEEFDSKKNSLRYWISVREDLDESNDQRYTKPSIKTPNSVRQVPVGKAVAAAIRCYVDNYRGIADHPYMVSSQHAKPMAAESVARMFQQISKSLPAHALEKLEERTGKQSVTPHDLRHTCAVLRLSQMLEAGESMDMALQKMRVFFGWTPGSSMPLKYARAVFEDDLQKKWDQKFDDRVEILRTLRSGNIP